MVNTDSKVNIPSLNSRWKGCDVFVLAIGWTDKLPLLCGNWTVNEVEESSSEPLENMVFGNSVVKSIYSPLIILSLMLRGTGGRSWLVEVIKLLGIVFISEEITLRWHMHESVRWYQIKVVYWICASNLVYLTSYLALQWVSNQQPDELLYVNFNLLY